MNPSGPKQNAISRKDQLKALWLNRVEMDTVTWDDLATAIGHTADQYEKLWQRMQSDSKNPYKTFSPCWAALPFFGVAWAMARRMPAYAVMMFIGMVVISCIIPSSGAVLGLALLVSFAQKSVYLRWLAVHIQHINHQGLVGEARQQALQAVGGLDAKSGWITAGVLLAVSALLAVGAGFR